MVSIAKRRLLIALISLIFSLKLLHVLEIPLIDWIDNKLYDLKVQNLSPAFDLQVVIADIDSKSLSRYGRWPWNRELIASLNDILFDYYRINTLGYDVIWAEPDPLDQRSLVQRFSASGLPAQLQQTLLRNLQSLNPDQLFADSIRARKIVLGYYFTNQSETQAINQLPAPAFDTAALPPATNTIAQWSSFSGNLRLLTENAAGSGFFSTVLDSDGIARTAPLLALHNGQYYQSLSLAVLQTFLQQPFVIPLYQQDYFTGLRLGDLEIPTQLDASVLIPYPQVGQSHQYLSLADILAKQVPPALLNNKIVLLGTSTPGLRDQRTSPSGSVIPGVELHANIIDGILHHQLIGIAEFNPLLLLLFTLISACLLALFLPVVSIYRALLMVLLILLILLVGSVLLWQVYWLELPVAVPLANLLLIYWLDSLIAYRNQTNSRHHILNMFGQYVPQSVLNIMIKSPDNYSMQSKDADLTILFCDIRNFTRISRQLTAAQLALLLNNYFDSLSQSIINHQGTLDKYIGDAIMAFWGNPIYIENHPELAVQAALDMMQRIEDLNVFLRSQNLPAIEIGIGVNTGTARVGNMGSSHRRTYTVIGDNVNIAARLEKLSKHYPVTIVVSEAVVEACPGIVFRALDQVVLEGGEQLITVYTPVL